MDHLNIMDHLKSSSGLKSYGQQNPILEYKKSSKQYFDKLNEDIISETINKISNLQIERPEEILEVKSEVEEKAEKAIEMSGNKEERTQKTIKNTEPKINRNDLCPCGSGKKYKKCCGIK